MTLNQDEKFFFNFLISRFSHQKADSRYGGYDPTRMKLVTANGEFTRDRNGNYEQHIPAQMQGQLANNRRGPQSMYGSTDSIHSGNGLCFSFSNDFRIFNWRYAYYY